MNLQNFKVSSNKKKNLSLREMKHLANSKAHSKLYFQIGLIATLFLFFGLFQIKFDKNEIVKPLIVLNDVIDQDFQIKDFIIEENIVKKIEEPIQKQVSYEDPTVIDNDIPVIEDFKPSPKVKENKSVAIDSILVDDLPPLIDTLPVSLVSDYPEYPGCGDFESRESKFKCFQNKIAKHIQRNFDSEIAIDNGLSGMQKINISFTINYNGDVVDVLARAPHPELQKEAVKAILSLPKMKPAKQGFKKVNVTYALPLIFKVD
jgi:periplasmic protein TonB